MKQRVLVGVVGIALLAVSPIHGKESGEKGGTADIKIGVGELQEGKSHPKISPGHATPARAAKPGAGPSRLKKAPAKPAGVDDGDPDRPLIRGSVPNPQGNDTKPSRDGVLKGKKILQN